MKRVDYYKTYYENLSPSNFKVEKEEDKIVISGIGTHYLKGFDDKDVKQYKVKQSKIDKYEKGGKVKNQQLEIIKRTNPAPNEYNLWVRTENDIKSAKEVFSDAFEGGAMYPDFTEDDMREVLKNGSVRVYSSYPIKEGVFVTPSKRNAQDYAGGQNSFVYSKKVSINDIAWLDESEGQYAPIENVKFGKYKRGGRIKPNKIVSSLQNTIDEVKNKIIEDADITQEQKKKLQEIRAYVVNGSRGMAWYQKGYFSVPLWCYEKQEMSSEDFKKKYHDWDKNWFDSHRGRKGYFIYYVAHELAHFLCYITNLLDCKGHKVGFYDAFLKLCPLEYQFYELNYIKKSDKYGVPTYEQCKLTPIEEQTPSTEFCLDGNFIKALDLWKNSMGKMQLT